MNTTTQPNPSTTDRDQILRNFIADLEKHDRESVEQFRNDLLTKLAYTQDADARDLTKGMLDCCHAYLTWKPLR